MVDETADSDDPPAITTGGPGRIRSEGDRRRRDPARVEALTDGVFAIVVTILVLEIAVPPNLSERSLFDALDELRPTLVAWVISFLLTGMYWVMHRDLFARIRYVNRDLVWLNLLFLLPVSLVPFAAQLLGEYPDEPIALRIYAVVLTAVTIMRTAMYAYVSRRPALLWEPTTTTARRRAVGILLAASPLPIYVLAMALADVASTVAVALLFALPGLYFILITVLRDRPKTSEDADEFS
jgi:uncharacterized membrane protein